MGITKSLIINFSLRAGLLIIGTATSCNSIQDDHCHQEHYYIIENSKLDSCNVYTMLFEQGDYIFRFALSGRCPTLTRELYLDQYTNFLKDYSDSLTYSEGKFIRLDFYEKMGIDKDMIARLVVATENISKKQVSIREFSEGYATLKIE